MAIANINAVWDAIGVFAEAAIDVSQGEPCAVQEYISAGDALKALIGERADDQSTDQELGGGYA